MFEDEGTGEPVRQQGPAADDDASIVASSRSAVTRPAVRCDHNHAAVRRNGANVDLEEVDADGHKIYTTGGSKKAVLRMWKMFVHEVMKIKTKRQFSQARQQHLLENQEREGKKLVKVVFGIGPDNHILPASRLIHPLSPFGIGWLCLTAVFLGYTAVMTPPIIAFHWLDGECAIVPTLPFDTAVDIFFLVDILMSLNTGRIVAGEYDDDRASVLKEYIFKGGLAFDLLTSIPVSFFELAQAQECRSFAPTGQHGNGEPVTESQSKLRMIRVMKPLRFMKIVRVFKLGKLSFVFDILCDRFNISPKTAKAFLTFVQLIMVIHILGSFWWLYKVLNSERAEVEDFLLSMKWGASGQLEPLETSKGKMQAYILSCYVITMTLTTVGYGDITADNSAERIAYILLFMGGAFIWGTLLAEVGEIHNASSQRETAKMESIQKMLNFLQDNDVSAELRVRIIQYIRFSENMTETHQLKKDMLQMLPAKLSDELMHQIYLPLILHVPVFNLTHSSVDPLVADRFLAEVGGLLQYASFTPEETLVSFSDPADQLIIICDGKVLVKFEHSYIVREPMELRARECFGDLTLLGDQDWGSSTVFNLEPNTSDEVVEICVTAHARTFVVILRLLAADFEAAMVRAPLEVKDFISNYSQQLHREREAWTSESDKHSVKLIRSWEMLVRKSLKHSRGGQRDGADDQWTFTTKIKNQNRAPMSAQRRRSNDSTTEAKTHLLARDPSLTVTDDRQGAAAAAAAAAEAHDEVAASSHLPALATAGQGSDVVLIARGVQQQQQQHEQQSVSLTGGQVEAMLHSLQAVPRLEARMDALGEVIDDMQLRLAQAQAQHACEHKNVMRKVEETAHKTMQRLEALADMLMELRSKQQQQQQQPVRLSRNLNGSSSPSSLLAPALTPRNHNTSHSNATRPPGDSARASERESASMVLEPQNPPLQHRELPASGGGAAGEVMLNEADFAAGEESFQRWRMRRDRQSMSPVSDTPHM